VVFDEIDVISKNRPEIWGNRTLYDVLLERIVDVCRHRCPAQEYKSVEELHAQSQQ
jgi:hypothetical protein